MELKDVKAILRRIQSNYSSFNPDAYMVQEWFRELKDYDLEDVMEKLNKHFRSEEYGNQIPKVYFLTRYCQKSEIKRKNITAKLKVVCRLCSEVIELKDYDTHYSRCSSANYIITQTQKYFNKKINRDGLMKLSQQEFDFKYNQLLRYVQKSTDDMGEIERIYKILNSKDNEQIDLKVSEVYKTI